jgi:hypothetical protein
MDEEYLATLGLLLFCGYLAYRLMRWLWPILEQRKTLTPLQMLDRAMAAPVEEQQRQALNYGSRKKTLVVHFVNFGLLLAWMYFDAMSRVLFWGVLTYQVIGFLVLRWVGLPNAPRPCRAQCQRPALASRVLRLALAGLSHVSLAPQVTEREMTIFEAGSP